MNTSAFFDASSPTTYGYVAKAVRRFIERWDRCQIVATSFVGAQRLPQCCVISQDDSASLLRNFEINLKTDGEQQKNQSQLVDGVYVGGPELRGKDKGWIEHGKLPDFVILCTDPTSVDPGRMTLAMLREFMRLDANNRCRSNSYSHSCCC